MRYTVVDTSSTAKRLVLEDELSKYHIVWSRDDVTHPIGARFEGKAPSVGLCALESLSDRRAFAMVFVILDCTQSTALLLIHPLAPDNQGCGAPSVGSRSAEVPVHAL